MSKTARATKAKTAQEHIFIPEPFSGQYDDEVEAAWSRSLPDQPSKMVPLLSLLYVTRALVDQFHARVLKQFDVSFIEYAIFNSLILNSNGLKPSVFTKLLALPSSHVTQIVNRLEARGLVARQKNPDDKRSVIIVLTRAGEELALRLCESIASESDKLASQLDGEDIKDLRKSMLRVIDIFD